MKPVPSEVEEIPEPKIGPNAPFKISKVAINRKSFNPSKGEEVTISWHISRSSEALVQIFDPEKCFVKELMSADIGNPGIIHVTWDGRDLEGNIVPDEAYFFTIEANEYRGGLTHYDPMTFSGGENFDFPVEFDSNKEMITYNLPKDSRILIRAGITHGPLLKTMVNWAPRPAGVNQDPWDGKDSSGTIYASDQKGFTMMNIKMRSFRIDRLKKNVPGLCLIKNSLIHNLPDMSEKLMS
jgi:flagellar hook assembly protein FlgD